MTPCMTSHQKMEAYMTHLHDARTPLSSRLTLFGVERSDHKLFEIMQRTPADCQGALNELRDTKKAGGSGVEANEAVAETDFHEDMLRRRVGEPVASVVVPAPAISAPAVGNSAGKMPAVTPKGTCAVGPGSLPMPLLSLSLLTAAPIARRWQVYLSNRWQSYATDVQLALEEAWERHDELRDVTALGVVYEVDVRAELPRQRRKDNKNMWRQVRRVIDR